MMTMSPTNADKEFSAMAQGRMEQKEGWSKKQMDASLAKRALGHGGLNQFHATVFSPDGQLAKLLFQRRGMADWKLVSVHLPQP